MARPRGKNFEKNLRYRTPPHLRDQITPDKASIEKAKKILEPTAEGVQEFRKSATYQLVRKTVDQAVDVNNKIHDLVLSAKDRKDPIYSDEQFAMIDRGIRVRPIYRIATDDLRNISYSSSLIGAIHQMVSDDASIYCNYNEDPGFKFKLKDPKAEVAPEHELEWEALSRFLVVMGDKFDPDWRERERMHEVIEMATRDSLALDAVAYLRTYNRKNDLSKIEYLDPGTIYRTIPSKGFDGNMDITHVQMIRSQVVETFERGRLVFRHKNNLSDVRMRGFGFSPIEQCLTEITSLLFTMKHNADRFNSRNPPKVLISSENSISPQDQERLGLEWENTYYGGRESFKLPMLFGTGKMQVHNLDVSDDFEFDKQMQIAAQLIASAHGIDSAQLGLKFNLSQSLSEPSMDGRQNFSRDRMHSAIMGFHQDCLNEILDPPDELPYRLVFNGVKTEDASKKADLSDKEFKSFKSLDELRKERDMPTLKEESEEYKRLGIFNDEEAKKHAKLGALRGNQFYSQAFTNVIAAPQDQGGMPPGQPSGEVTGTEGGDGLPWNEEDFGEFEE